MEPIVVETVSQAAQEKTRIAVPVPCLLADRFAQVEGIFGDMHKKQSGRFSPDLRVALQRFMLLAAFCGAVMFVPQARSGGITPEQIYQPVINWNDLIGTWEVLPEGNPLEEASKASQSASERTLMTLRVDGTCRVFAKDHPTGSDGLWSFEHHEMFITFKNAAGTELYIYGVKGDFMVTRTPIKGGKDQLWSRIK